MLDQASGWSYHQLGQFQALIKAWEDLTSYTVRSPQEYQDAKDNLKKVDIAMKQKDWEDLIITLMRRNNEEARLRVEKRAKEIVEQQVETEEQSKAKAEFIVNASGPVQVDGALPGGKDLVHATYGKNTGTEYGEHTAGPKLSEFVRRANGIS